MRDPGSLLPLNIGPLLPPPLRRVAAPLESALERWVVPDHLAATIRRAEQSGDGARFASRLLDEWEIRFVATARDLAQFPVHGAAIVVANHPRGIVEGLILTVLLESVRPDYRVLVNSGLSRIDPMGEHAIWVNPFATAAAHAENRAPLRRCIRWLAGGGLLAMFPAGEVAHLNWTDGSAIEPCWNTAAVRLALHTRTTVIPVFFEGCNSLPFHLAGTLHPGLRTMALPREFMKMRGKTVEVRIGSPISWDLLKQYRTVASASEYLRSRTLFLTHRPHSAAPDFPANAPQKPVAPVRPQGCDRMLAAEADALPPSATLVRSQEFSVFAARAGEIPNLLAEIGRCREEAFRLVGEGTGKETDVDWFDRHYCHLILWHNGDRRLAGAYRMALTRDVIAEHGVRGLYTSTLFHFKPAFFDRLGPALELGRSFVCPDYQKSYAPLLLLWKGIARFVQQHPEAAVLFGAVSISREYQEASRGLIASYLAGRMLRHLTPLVRPRKKWRGPTARQGIVKNLAAVAASLDDISLSISDIESDRKGVPVLIRQYLKAGGRVIAFNLDCDFSDSVDALIAADLRTAPLSLLERCMGRSEAKAFLEWHSRCPAPAANPAPWSEVPDPTRVC